MAITRHTLSALLVIGLRCAISTPFNESLVVNPGAKINEIILKYPENDAITLHSVLCTGIMEH